MNSFPKDIYNLYNPAFCGSIIYNFVCEYNKEKEKVPFVYFYVLIPFSVYDCLLESVSSRSYFETWKTKNKEFLFHFSKKINSFLPIVDDAIVFLLSLGLINIDNEGCVSMTANDINLNALKKNMRYKKIFKSMPTLAKWFLAFDNVEDLFLSLGVKL